MLFNGVPLDKQLENRVFGYVEQEDAVHENLTVREVSTDIG